MRVKTLWWLAAAILLLPALLFALLFLYIQSSSFHDRLASIASETIGSSVELGDDVSVASLFPDIVLNLDSVRLNSDEPAAGVRRARLQELQLSMSPSLLFSKGVNGELEVQIGRGSVIAEVSGQGSETSSQASRNINVNALRETITSLLSSINNHSGISANLAISHVDFITRDKEKRSTKYVVKDFDVEVIDVQASATARIIWSDLAEQQLSLQLEEMAPQEADHSLALARRLVVEVSPSVGVHSAGTLTADISLGGDIVDISQMEVKTDWLWLRADASIDWSSADLNVRADLEMRRLELSALMSVDSEHAEVTSAERLFPYDVFSWAIPLNVAADVALHLGAVRLDSMPLANGALAMTLSNGVLQVISEDLTVLGGRSALSVEVDNTLAQLVAFKSKLEVDELQLSRIRLGDDSESVVSQGNADLIVSLKGEGPSPGHIAASLDGYVLAGMSDTKVNQRYSTLIDRGIVSWAVQKAKLWSGNNVNETRVNPSLSDPLFMECISLRVYINDGRAEVSNGAIINFPDNTLFSSGFVDLASEELGFAFRTRSRSLFDWSAISIIKYAEISGTLVQPKVALNTKELAKQGIKSASSAAWGPLPAFVYSLAEAGVKNANNGTCKSTIW